MENDLNWYRGFIQGKTRITLAWIFAILIGISARSYPTWPGIVICFLGASLRFWASGFLRKDSKPAVGGPYAFVRNPLYLGTYAMALGATIAIENWELLAISTVLFAAVYHFIILDEEVKLRKTFGSRYIQYCQAVPRFFPRLWPPFAPAKKSILIQINPDLSQHCFSIDLALRNKAYEAYASFSGLVGFLALAAFLWKNFVD